jgi:probable HAF family extracellular repeat protein
MRAPERVLLIAVTALACAGDVGGPTTPEYDVIDLGALLPACDEAAVCESRAYDINETAVIVGFHTATGPFMLDGTRLTVLPGAPDCPYGPGKCGYAVSINTSGQVVGQLDTLGGSSPWGAGVLWTNGVAQALPIFATDIDDTDRIVGSIQETNADGTWTIAAMLGPDSIVRFGTLGGRVSEATAIGSAGHVVGWSEAEVDTSGDFPILATRAFLVPSVGAGLVHLGVLPGAQPGDGPDRQHSWANAVNGTGDVVGWSDAPPWLAGPDYYGYARRPVVWRDGSIVELSTLGGLNGSATDINELGWIVGGTLNADGRQRATLWRGGEIVDLGSLPGYSGSHAYRINDAGDIVGYSFGLDGTTPPQATRATLWRRMR